MKHLRNIEKFERMEYILNKIIFITEFENLNIYFKTRAVDGIFYWVLMVYDIDIHQLNLGQFRNLKFLDEMSFKKCVFCICLIMDA